MMKNSEDRIIYQESGRGGLGTRMDTDERRSRLVYDGGMTHVDWLVLTAANNAQARAYTAQLRARARRGILAPPSRWSVIADPGNRRVGSGGSTLWVLFTLAKDLLSRRPDSRTIHELFEGLRILIIHSGGESRRLCAYAAQGKIFLPLPCSTEDGNPATLFDLVLADLAGLPAPSGGQVLVASGDVLLSFDPATVDFTNPGVTGVAYPGPMERGSRHGVYVSGPGGRVYDFIQKPDESTARARGAIDSVGRVLVDTGLVSLDPRSVELWLESAGVHLRKRKIISGTGLLDDIGKGKSPPIDLYQHILMAMPPAIGLSSYLKALVVDRKKTDAGHLLRLDQLHKSLHGHPFHVNVLPYCDFFHIGSSRELLSNVGTLNRTARTHRFSNFDRSFVAERASLEDVFVYNSILDSPQISAEKSVLLESVHARCPVELPGRNIVVGWPGEARVPLRLPGDWGMVCLPVRSSGKESSAESPQPWSVVIFGLGDDFKTPVTEDGSFGGAPLADFMRRHGLRPGELWQESSPHLQTLWEARLWTVGPIDEVLRETLWMCGGQSAGPPGTWRRRRRVSMAELLNRVDHARLLQHREGIQRLGELHSLAARLEEDAWLPAERVLALLHGKKDAATAMEQVDRVLEKTSDPLVEARLYKLASLIHGRAGGVLPSRPRLRGNGLDRSAFDAVARAVGQQITLPLQPRKVGILHDQVVWVTCPVRLDLAGGWSDTPPVCTELGGTVLNAAVTLNGQYPVQVIAKLSERRSITLTSLDLGKRVEIVQTPALPEYQDPSDWAALPKAALILAGVCPHDPREKLDRWLKTLGGGLDITLFSALPKGSGLGTSSILGAAMLACLARVLEEPVSRETLIARTSLLEQMMTTAGGWQDQVGGVVPGIKLIRTSPGPDQAPGLHWTVFDLSSGSELRSRLLLYYTGYKRLAKNILHNVVSRYLARDPEAITIIRALKELAEEMWNDLGAGDVDAFGRGIGRYWELKKKLDPGSTNDAIETLLRPVDRYLTGKVLPGAGGGGFVLMLARDAGAAKRVRILLRRNPPNRMARFFDFDIDQKGLAVTVL
jgi:fucokinase